MLPIKLNLPDDFLKEEARFGYTVSTEMKKVWAIELDLLKQAIDICNKYNIRYYIVSGTLLGAVRHKGFIPWDDDIDIAMFRDDYEKFCSHYMEFKKPYELQFYDVTKGYFTGHAQLRNTETTGVLKSRIKNISVYKYNQGIFIDIFVLDAIADNKIERKKQTKNIKLYKKLAQAFYNAEFNYNIFKEKPKYKPLHILNRIMPSFFKYSYFYDGFEVNCKKYNSEQTQRVGFISFAPQNTSFWFKRSYFNKSIELDFEMFTVSAPFDYDLMLKDLYGNYMEYVIGNSLHGGVIFDTETPYCEWIKNLNRKQK